jgi:hypothetical protein
MMERPAANGALHTTSSAEVVCSVPLWSRKLIVLGQRVGELPIYGSTDWFALPPVDPRKFGSVVRAAECWRLDGTDDVLRWRLLDEIRFNNEFAAWRLRMLSADLSDGEDWSDVAGSIDRSRRARAIHDAGYTQPDRVPVPWSAESLDPANWRDDPNPSPNVPPGLRFRRHDMRVAS